MEDLQDSYASAEERGGLISDEDLGRELAREQRSLHLGKDIMRRLRAAMPPNDSELVKEQSKRQETLAYVQALQIELAKRRKQKQQQPTRAKLIGY